MSSSTPKVLKVQSSGRHTGSHSRSLVDRLAERVAKGGEIVSRDVADGIEFVDEAWIGANFTPADQRAAEQKQRLSGSDALVKEVQDADILVIGAPIYNFGVPAALKAWIDQIARANVTFRYTPDGPVGLLEGKKAYVVVASGGTPIGSEIDFASGYMRHVLGFIGISDVTIVPLNQLMVDEDAAKAEAERLLEAA